MIPKITEIQIIPIKPSNGLVAFASCLINDSLYLGSIAIHTKLDGSGLRLTYPTKKAGSQNLPIFHPINKEFSKTIEEAIFQRYKELMT